VKAGQEIVPGTGYVVVVDAAGNYQQLVDGRTGRVIWDTEPGRGLQEKLGEKAGTGIFMKQLDSGRRVYSCKCPDCGTVHGGYRTFAEAQRNRKCREHHRKEIDKTKKEIEKVDEPKKQKNIFQNNLNKAKVIGEDAIDFEDEQDWKEEAGLVPELAVYEMCYGMRLFFEISDNGELRWTGDDSNFNRA